MVSQGKPVSSSCGYPAAPTAINTESATYRSHPYEWHATANHDWIEIDLQQGYAVTTVTFYNRADCCQQRAAGAALMLMDSNRNHLASVSLNSGLVQTFSFNSPYTDAQNALNAAQSNLQAATSQMTRANNDLPAARIARDKARVANDAAKTAQNNQKF